MSLALGLGLAIGGGGSPSLSPPAGFGAAGGLWVRSDFQGGAGTLANLLDSSGNGNNVPAVNGAQLCTVTNGAGPKASQPGMVFVAPAVYKKLSALIGANNFTISITAKPTTVASGMAWIISGDGATNGFVLGTNYSANNERNFNAAGVVAVNDTTSNAAAAWESWIFSCTAGHALTLFVNGSAHTLSPASATAVSPAASFFIGGGPGGNFSGTIAEVIVYPTALATFTALNAYLSAQWGLF